MQRTFRTDKISLDYLEISKPLDLQTPDEFYHCGRCKIINALLNDEIFLFLPIHICLEASEQTTWYNRVAFVLTTAIASKVYRNSLWVSLY